MPIFMFPEEELTKEELDDLIRKTELQRHIYEKLCDIEKTFDNYKQLIEEG